MEKQSAIKVFNDKKIRTLWNEDKEKWYFSIIDVIAVLTESIDANAYWRKLKQRQQSLFEQMICTLCL